jgi:hypothetical protein
LQELARATERLGGRLGARLRSLRSPAALSGAARPLVQHHRPQCRQCRYIYIPFFTDETTGVAPSTRRASTDRIVREFQQDRSIRVYQPWTSGAGAAEPPQRQALHRRRPDPRSH